MKRHKQTRLCLEILEDRTTPSYAFGSAFALGTSLNDNALTIAADSAGNVGVIGNYALGNLPSEPIDLDPGAGSYLLPSGAGYDRFVAQYDAAGNLLGGLRMTSAAGFGASEAAMDEAGNLFVAGRFDGSMEFAQPGATAVTLTETADGYGGFLAKIDPAGSVRWARTLGEGAGSWVANGIAVDSAGNVYATGNSDNLNQPGQPAAVYHMHVDKFDGSSGTPVWSRVVSGGTGISWAGYYTDAKGIDVAVDAVGHVHVVGGFMGDIDFNPDPNQTNLLFSYRQNNSININDDGFVLELDGAGSYVWAGSMPGPGQFESISAVAVDGTGYVYLTGNFEYWAGDADPGPGTLTLPVGAYFLRLGANHQVLWSMSGVGGIFEVDTAGNVYQHVNVYQSSPGATIDADPGPGTFNLTMAGSNDVFVRKLDSSGNFVWAGAIGGPGNDLSPGNPIAVDGQGNIYTTGWFEQTADFDPGVGTYSLTSTPDANGNTTYDAFVLKLIPTEPPPPALRISDVTVSEGNTTVSAVFTVTLSAASDQTVTVSYSSADGAASAGGDYQAASGTLTFAPGETSKTVTVLVNGDRLGEPNETFVVNLSSPSNATLADGHGVGTILEDEPRISISDVIKAEGKKGQTTLFTFTVTLSAAYDQPVTMSFGTVNDTAKTNNSDYVARTGTLTFNPGETTKTITIEVKGDSKKEANETFYLDLFGNSSSLFTKNRGIGTILNDD